MLSALNRNEKEYDYSESPGCTKIKIFTKFNKKYVPPQWEDDRTTIRHLRLPGKKNILLAVTHLPSKMYSSSDSLAIEAGILAGRIRCAENLAGHSRTILAGDLNMNPFEVGIVGSANLHGVMDRKIAQKKERKVQSRKYPFFYNPMWGMLGDSRSGPPGSFYYPGTQHVEYFWHMFDQVMLRPDLLEYFDNRDLKILLSDDEYSLITKDGLPDKKTCSDHLPLFFKLTV